MTLLHAGLLEPCSECYTDRTPSPYMLSFRLKKLARLYSSTLCDLLARMLEADSAARLGVPELEAELNLIVSAL